MKQYNDIEKDLARHIGGFYMMKAQKTECGEDEAFAICHRSLQELDIHDISFEGTVLTISLSRPGLLIGAKGENLYDLQEHLNTKMKRAILIKVFENRLNYFLYPYPVDLEEF